MQRPFNGGCNGGGMIRTVQRVIRAGAGGASTAEPLSGAAGSSSSTNSRKSHSLITSFVNTPPTLSSSSANNVRERFPSVVINDVRPNVSGDGSNNSIGNDWECIEGTSFHGNSDDDEFVCEDYSRLFGTVPSRDEVVSAVSELQQFVEASSSSSSCTCSPKRGSGEYTEIEDWIEPSLNLYVSNTIQTRGSTERVYDAFHLLQKDPSVQRMVVSLSSDKAVWAAVMENEVVKELTSSISQDTMAFEEDGSQNGSIDDDDEENPMKNIFVSIIAKAKETVMILIDKITKVVNGIILESPNGEEKSQDNDAHQPFEDKLKASLMLSIVVLLIVIVARAQSIIR